MLKRGVATAAALLVEIQILTEEHTFALRVAAVLFENKVNQGFVSFEFICLLHAVRVRRAETLYELSLNFEMHFSAGRDSIGILFWIVRPLRVIVYDDEYLFEV